MPATGTITFNTFAPNGSLATGSYAIKGTYPAFMSSTFTATLCHDVPKCR